MLELISCSLSSKSPFEPRFLSHPSRGLFLSPFPILVRLDPCVGLIRASSFGVELLFLPEITYSFI